jgi:hypothetical protein
MALERCQSRSANTNDSAPKTTMGVTRNELDSPEFAASTAILDVDRKIRRQFTTDRGQRYGANLRNRQEFATGARVAQSID